MCLTGAEEADQMKSELFDSKIEEVGAVTADVHPFCLPDDFLTFVVVLRLRFIPQLHPLIVSHLQSHHVRAQSIEREYLSIYFDHQPDLFHACLLHSEILSAGLRSTKHPAPEAAESTSVHGPHHDTV
jgi:hypothetical protein